MATGDEVGGAAMTEFIPIKDLEEEFNSVATKFRNELQKAHERCSIQKDEIIKLKKELKQTEQRHSREQDYLRNMNEENKTHIERLNEHIKSMNIKIKELNSEHNKETEQLKFELNEVNHSLTSKTNEEKIRTTEMEYKICTLEEEKAKYGETEKNLNAEVTRLKSEKEQLHSQLQSCIKTSTGQVETLTDENTRLTSEIERLKESLKRMMSERDRLHWNYVKRPTYIAEEFSELYDNEWADVIYFDTNSEEKTIAIMLTLLQRAYEICTHCMQDLVNAVGRTSFTFTIPTRKLQNVMMASEENYDEVPGRLAFVRNVMKTSEENYDAVGSLASERTFQCCELGENTVHDIRKQFASKVSEDIDKIGTEIILTEQKIDPCKKFDAAAYVRKCLNVCWSMCMHNPPMHLDFPVVTEGMIFDTSIYKPYTKRGKYLEYIVWPALYLHEGGPCLSKGVVQGRR